ncbi:MAG: glycosyltransferase [Defluviitaleaceae bacterium]|nr:glycosyltransferase [Defluviitaleaceae bacterium]
MAKITKDVTYFEKILEAGLNNLHGLSANFLRWQYLVASVTDSRLTSKKTRFLSDEIYKKSFDEIYNPLKQHLTFIPKSERFKNYCIVMTTQLLSMSHAPTRRVMGRCRALQDSLGMRTDIINTNEMLSSVGAVPYYNRAAAKALDDQLSEANFISFWGNLYGFYSPKVPMPDINEISLILNRIRREKPYFIVQVGGNSLTADLCAQLVPVLTVPTNSVNLPTTYSQFISSYGKLAESHYVEIDRRGLDRESVIEGASTFNLREQTETYSRKSLGLSEDKFHICIIGNRLDGEVDSDFLNMMSETIKFGVHYVFVGPAAAVEKNVARMDPLVNNCSFLGHQNEVLAVLEVCDLYVNPGRIGGGASVAEAMAKGLPAVTLRYGDVYVSAGEDFGVDTYDEMVNLISLYAQDKAFYSEMSEKAKARAEEMLDTNKAFSKIIHTMLDSPLLL